jgi:precorrin-2 dehydrogenase / sirohydrochlorin ferrochelatase
MYPVYLKMDGRSAIVIGAGTVAERKIQTLLDAGAKVTVVAPDATDAIKKQVANGVVKWKQRAFRGRDMRGAMLIITATSDPAVNTRVFKLASRRGQLVNSVDDPNHCSFYVPAIVRRAPLIVAISSSGRSPLFAKQLRRYLDRKLYPDIGSDVEAIGEERDRILAGSLGLSQKERARRISNAQEAGVKSILERIELA